MHGFFLSLKLYDAARLIANPFAYAEHRERVVRDKLEKLSESRIRSRGGAGGDVKVNKALAERIRRDERRAERRREKEGVRGEQAEQDAEEDTKTKSKASDAGSLLHDPRFAEVFEDPDFEVDTMSREFGLLNPSSSTAMNAVRLSLVYHSFV
jgi:ribosome biogenesis protein ENP2